MHTVFVLLAQAGTNPAAVPGGADPTKWLIWGIVLLAIALALFFVEAFLPTGGIVGGISGLAAVGGVVCLFWRDSTLGLAAAAGVILALPFAIGFALKVMPDTPFAKWVTLKDAQDRVNRHDEPYESSIHCNRQNDDDVGSRNIAVGDTGRTLTPLFPVGTCLIGDRREECLAQRGTIDAGENVRVVRVDGSEVLVAPV